MNVRFFFGKTSVCFWVEDERLVNFASNPAGLKKKFFERSPNVYCVGFELPSVVYSCQVPTLFKRRFTSTQPTVDVFPLATTILSYSNSSRLFLLYIHAF